MAKNKMNPLEFFRKAGEDRMKKMRAGGQKAMMPKYQDAGQVGEDEVPPEEGGPKVINEPGKSAKPVSFNVGVGKFNVGYRGTNEGGKLTNSNINVEGSSKLGKKGTISGGVNLNTTTDNVGGHLSYERQLGKKGKGPILKVSGSYNKKGGSVKSKSKKK